MLTLASPAIFIPQRICPCIRQPSTTATPVNSGPLSGKTTALPTGNTSASRLPEPDGRSSGRSTRPGSFIEYAVVVVEDLDLKPMLETSQNARQKQDAAWVRFLDLLG